MKIWFRKVELLP